MPNTSGYAPVRSAKAPHGGQMSHALPASAFDGVRTRRVMAFLVDFAIVCAMLTAATLLLAVPTLGLSLFLVVIFLPAVFGCVAFFYNGFCVASPNMGTPGMRLMDIEIGTTAGTRVRFIHAAVHALLFYASWFFPPVFLVSLLSDDKRCVHDMLADVIVTRRTL